MLRIAKEKLQRLHINHSEPQNLIYVSHDAQYLHYVALISQTDLLGVLSTNYMKWTNNGQIMSVYSSTCSSPNY
jgi:hypothetical protein